MSSTSVACWRRAAIDLVSERTYANPYADVAVRVTFAGPGGVGLTREAFWYKDNVWQVRFAPVAVGHWTWRTTCSDTANGALHQRTGCLEATPYQGALPIYQHGFLRLSANGRYLAHADGQPFFWLGDTHWQMPDTERIEACNHPEHAGQACSYGGQFQHLVADRLAKGFTVYQTYPSAISPHWWSSAFTKIDPARFAAIFDRQMDYLADHGLVIALGFGHYHNSTNIPLDDIRRWARYLVARYGAHPVVWITCQEMNAPEKDGQQNQIAVWQAMAREIARVDGYQHPHSGHQWVLDVGTRPLGHELWHNWFALQGGHRASGLTPQARYAGYYAFRPVKPIIETEAMYEQVDCGGVAHTDDARRSAWKAMLSGCAGYTYGAAGVWALKWDPADPQWQAYNHQIAGWYAGLALPGSQQMAVMKAFFLNLPWPALTPRFGDSAWATWDDRECSVLATDRNRLYVAYFYGTTARGVLKQIDAAVPYCARWFDPRQGRYRKIDGHVQAAAGCWPIPEKPDNQDWVLILQETQRGASSAS